MNILKYLILGFCFIINNKVLTQQTCMKQTLNFNSQTNEGYTIDYNPGNVIQKTGVLTLQLTQATGGTRISLNNKLRYGTVSSRLKVSPGSNIVSSFILMADNGDEIDFEFVGKDDNVIQTNFFYKGVPIYDKNAKFYDAKKKLSDSFNTFTIIWTPEYYEWKFNNLTLRRLFKNATVNFPDSLSHVQFGIWRANPSNWAGWGVNWADSPFEYSIDWIKVNCNATETDVDKQIDNKNKTINGNKVLNKNNTLSNNKNKTVTINDDKNKTSNGNITNQEPEKKSDGVNIYQSLDSLFLILVTLIYN